MNFEPKSVYDFTVQDIKGQSVNLKDYVGTVLILVNVASNCGLTNNNYGQLQAIYEKYAPEGLEILAFPSNQFAGQEPGSPEEIIQFVKNKGVTFPLMAKINVNGQDVCPLWKYCKKVLPGFLSTKTIKWNFTKFLVDRKGIPVKRYGPYEEPNSMIPEIERLLNEKIN
ncbi:uncharacterized protein LOC135121855 [Zophobas morio]|uniref:uncharacterized protein LOC135121855 n=1 Tax=Zophobas morio TaxID=2755281 RepID=UPI003082B5F7